MLFRYVQMDIQHHQLLSRSVDHILTDNENHEQ